MFPSALSHLTCLGDVRGKSNTFISTTSLPANSEKRTKKPIGIESKTSEIFSQLNYAKEKNCAIHLPLFYYRYLALARGLNGDKILARKAIYIQDNQ
jgi:hypothetical protein